MTITVGEVNEAPVLEAIGNKTWTNRRCCVHGHGQRTRRLPANALTLSATRACRRGPRSTPATRVFAWTPSEAQQPGSTS